MKIFYTNSLTFTKKLGSSQKVDQLSCSLWSYLVISTEQFRVFSGLKSNEEYQKHRPTKLRFRGKIAKIGDLRFEFEYERRVRQKGLLNSK